MTLDATPPEGALSIDQAVGLLSGGRQDDDAPAAAVETSTSAAEDGADEVQQNDASAPEADEASEAEQPGDGEEAEQLEPDAAASAADAPQWWSAEDKALWANASPELQAAIARQEGKREQVLTKAKQEAETAKNGANSEAETYRTTLQAIGDWLPGAVETFKSRWDGITAEDWAEFAKQDPQGYTAAKAQHDLEQKQLTDAQAEHEKAQKVQRAEALKAEAAKLPEYAPALVDPKEGPARKRELAKFLVESGVDSALLPDLTAVALGLAYDAMLYRRGQAKLDATKKPAAQPAPKGNTSPTAPPARTSQQRSLEQLNARLNKSGKIDDAVAVLQARRKG